MVISELQMTSKDTKNCQHKALDLYRVESRVLKKAAKINLISNFFLSLI